MSRPRGVPAVFLDRDGVLNEAIVRDGRPFPPMSAEELRILPGVVDACDQLHLAGFVLVVVTNQPDIARGLLGLDDLRSIHDALRREVNIDLLYVCPHDDADGCHCRKPAPGMLLGAARHHHLDLASSFMVGDRWRDIESGRRAGCRTVLVDNGYREQAAEGADAVVASLAQATVWIQANRQASSEARIG